MGSKSVDKPKQFFRNALLIMTVCLFETYYVLTNKSFKIVEDFDISSFEFCLLKSGNNYKSLKHMTKLCPLELILRNEKKLVLLGIASNFCF